MVALEHQATLAAGAGGVNAAAAAGSAAAAAAAERRAAAAEAARAAAAAAAADAAAALARSERRLNLVTREKDSLNRVLQSYDNEAANKVGRCRLAL